jgi:hypothetical protein
MSKDPLGTLLRRALRLDPPSGFAAHMEDHARRVVRGEVEPRHRPVALRTVALSAALLALVAVGSVKVFQDRAARVGGRPPATATQPPAPSTATPLPSPAPTAAATPPEAACQGDRDNAEHDGCTPISLLAFSPAGVGIASDTIFTRSEPVHLLATVLRSPGNDVGWTVVWRGGSVNDLQWVDGNEVVLATDAGLVASYDAGRTWHVGATTWLTHVRFASPAVGLAVTIDGRLLRTVDGGRTFTRVDPGMEAGAVEVLPSGRAWLAGPAGIAASSDFGVTWVRQRTFTASPQANLPAGSAPYRFWQERVHFLDARHGYVLYRTPSTVMNQDGVGFYATADGGHTWTAEFTDGFASNPTGEQGAGFAPHGGADLAKEFSAVSPGTLLFADTNLVAQPMQAYGCRSTDSGAHSTCTALPLQVDANGSVGNFAVADQAGSQQWLASVGDMADGRRGLQVLASSDGGVHWTVRWYAPFDAVPR